jgi:hypothetical protein
MSNGGINKLNGDERHEDSGILVVEATDAGLKKGLNEIAKELVTRGVGNTDTHLGRGTKLTFDYRLNTSQKFINLASDGLIALEPDYGKLELSEDGLAVPFTLSVKVDLLGKGDARDLRIPFRLLSNGSSVDVINGHREEPISHEERFALWLSDFSSENYVNPKRMVDLYRHITSEPDKPLDFRGKKGLEEMVGASVALTLYTNFNDKQNWLAQPSDFGKTMEVATGISTRLRFPGNGSTKLQFNGSVGKGFYTLGYEHDKQVVTFSLECMSNFMSVATVGEKWDMGIKIDSVEGNGKVHVAYAGAPSLLEHDYSELAEYLNIVRDTAYYEEGASLRGPFIGGLPGQGQ